MIADVANDKKYLYPDLVSEITEEKLKEFSDNVKNGKIEAVPNIEPTIDNESAEEP